MHPLTLYPLINGSDANSVRKLDTPLIFKRALLNNRSEINIVPKHFMYGPRKLNVKLTHMGKPVTILAAFNCNFSNLFESETSL
jgi:hypothetical protein